ncbi:MAG: hypothetical protein F4208_05795, partial [Gemmatimonadales bacterium]|nr:hypothetical protein [Gemmatimonadales bacterium]
MKTDGTDLRPADVQSRRAFIATAAAGVGAVASGSLAACGPDGGEAAAGAPDAGAPDAGATDAGGGIVVARGPIAVEAGIGALKRG